MNRQAYASEHRRQERNNEEKKRENDEEVSLRNTPNTNNDAVYLPDPRNQNKTTKEKKNKETPNNNTWRVKISTTGLNINERTRNRAK